MGEKEQTEGVKGEQRTGKVTEDGDEDEASMGMRGDPWQRNLLKQRDDVDDYFAEQKFVVHAIMRRALMKRASWRLSPCRRDCTPISTAKMFHLT